MARSEPSASPLATRKSRKVLLPVAAAILIALVAAGLYLRSKSSARLTEKDSVLLADFVNTTGDAVFDGTLKQALAVQLEQSPYLNIVPESKIREALRLMGKPRRRTADQRRCPRNLPASEHQGYADGQHRQPRQSLRHHPGGTEWRQPAMRWLASRSKLTAKSRS